MQNINRYKKPLKLTPTLSENRKSIELFYEFKWRSVTSATDLLSKLVTYFLTLATVILGFLYTQELSQQHERVFIYLLLVLVALYFVIICAFGWGVYAGLIQIRNVLKEYDSLAFDKLRTHYFIRRAIVVGVIVSGACLLVLALICTVVLTKTNCPESLALICKVSN